jgi:hypothetical protein
MTALNMTIGNFCFGILEKYIIANGIKTKAAENILSPPTSIPERVSTLAFISLNELPQIRLRAMNKNQLTIFLFIGCKVDEYLSIAVLFFKKNVN